MKRITRSKINKRIIKSFGRIGLTFLILFFALNFSKIQGTNSFFTDTATSSGNVMSAGYWIPELTMSVEAPDPDGWYRTAPCVTLTADINEEAGGITIYYEFSADGNPIDGGTVYPGACVPVPDGDPTHFQAQAYNNENHDWRSNIVSEDFKIHSGAKEGDVVINELMWMGSEKDNGDYKYTDEWIELKNTTSHEINIKNWNIYGAVSEGGGHLEIAANPLDDFNIPAHGYFLIANYSKSDSLINEDVDLVKTSINFNNNYDNNGQVILKDKGGNVIDSAPAVYDEHWPKGKNESGKKWSMERNLTPGDGTDSGSWHTCDREQMSSSDLATMKNYWDNNAQNYNCGTPGHVNLSKNDPTAPDFDPTYVETTPVNDPETIPDPEEEAVLEPAAEENNLPADIPNEVPAGDNTIQRSSDIVTGGEGNNIPANEAVGGETAPADETAAIPETPPVNIPADTSDTDNTNNNDNITERSSGNVTEEKDEIKPEVTNEESKSEENKTDEIKKEEPKAEETKPADNPTQI